MEHQPNHTPDQKKTYHLKRFSVLLYAIRDLLYRKKFSFLFVISLSIGLFSFLLIDSMKVSFDNYVTNNSKLIAGGDMRIFSRRQIQPNELAYLQKRYATENVASQVTYYSMANNTRLANNLRLIRVSLISETFPLYDELWVTDFTGNRIPWETAQADMENNPVLAITKELLLFFEVTEGDQIQVGDKPYTAKYIIAKDVGNRLQISALAYKVYIALNQRDEGVLTDKGATTRFTYYVRAPDLSDNALTEDVADLNNSLKEVTEANKAETGTSAGDTLRVRSHNETGSNIQRVNNTVNSYFELVTLVTLFLSGIGVFYLFRSFIFSKVKEIAILESLGMAKAQIMITMVTQLILLGLASVLTSLALFFMFRPLIDILFGNLIANGFSVGIHPASVYAITIIAVLGATLFTFPIVWAASKISIITLIRQNLDPRSLLRMTLWSFLPMVLFFYLLAIWMGDSVALGSAFSGLFIATIVVVFILGFVFWKAFSGFRNSSKLTLSFIARSLHQNRSKSFFYFFAIALSVALISLTPQLQYSISSEIESPKGLTIPTLFVFEIRKSDLVPMEKTITANDALMNDPIPFISAEIISHNGEEFKGVSFRGGPNNNNPENREETDRPRRNQVNMSYRSPNANLDKVYETITDGKVLTTDYTLPPGDDPLNPNTIAELSIEEDFASQNNLKIGDRLTFTLINVPFTFTGEIANLRKVNWNTFQPNFFIMVQDQVLNDIPQKYVTSVEEVKPEKKVQLMTQLNQQFPNMSILDVQEIIKELLTLIDKFSVLLRLMAGFCLALGLLILFSIINQEMKNQAQEINLMKAIGGTFSTLYVLVLGEYTLIGFLAILSGMIPSVAVNYVLGMYFYDGSFVFSPMILLQVFALIMPLIIIVNYLAARKILLEKPILLLKGS